MKTPFQYLFLLIPMLAMSCKLDVTQDIETINANTILAELTEKEDSIVSNSEITIELARILKSYTGNSIEYLKIGDEEGQLASIDSTSIFSRVNSKDEFELLERIIHAANNDNYSFTCYYDSYNEPYIAIIKDTDEFNCIRKRSTHAYNYDLENEDLIERLKEWKKKYVFSIVGVASDFIDIKFETPLDQTNAFKSMVVDFCPDAADWLNDTEYVLLMEEGSDYLNLWWD